METLKYKIIKSNRQYNDYCNQLEQLLNANPKSKPLKEEIELLSLLIEKWDSEHNSFHDSDPVQLLKSLMEEHQIKAVELSTYLSVSKGLVSDILNYKKGMSKEIIRKLSERFKLTHEAFNRHYALNINLNGKNKSRTLSNQKKRVAA